MSADLYRRDTARRAAKIVRDACAYTHWNEEGQAVAEQIEALAAPAQSREPLTDEQIEAAMNPCDDSDMGRHLRREFIAAFKRVYARLHGITKETTK